MHVPDLRRTAALLLAVTLGGAATLHAGPAPALKLKPSQLTAYTGTAVLVQSIGNDVTKFDFDASALYLTPPEKAGDVKVLLTARYLKSASGDETFGSVDRYRVNDSGTALDLVPLESKVFELSDHLHMMNVYLPWETLPTFALPAAGETNEGKESVNVLNLANVDAKLRTTTVEADRALEVTRALVGSETPGFNFRDNDAKLILYRQKYSIDRTTGRVEAIESDCAFEFSQGGTTIRLERKFRLEEESTATLDGSNVPGWAGLLKELPAIEKSFDDRGSSEDIGKLVSDFAKKGDKTPLAALAGALRFRLMAYQQFFEASAQGRILAGVLNRKAPDFTLKDLDGKDVAFREATAKNKVTLLSFWGYG